MQKGIFSNNMSKTISVNEAISKGHRMVTYPVYVIMFGIMGLSVFLQKKLCFSFSLMALSFLSSFIFAWLYWSIVITKWRIWAFYNVDNMYELHNKAVSGMLIWERGSFFEKTEIRTKKDKEKLKKIGLRITESNFFNL